MGSKEKDLEQIEQRERERGMIMGLVIFIPVGIALSLVLRNPGLLGAGVPIGISVGLAIADRRIQQRKDQG